MDMKGHRQFGTQVWKVQLKPCELSLVSARKERILKCVKAASEKGYS